MIHYLTLHKAINYTYYKLYLEQGNNLIQAVKSVAIVGGTHGNELTGVYLVNKFINTPALVSRDSFNTLSLLANPKAVEKCTRYIDKDLNRTFSKKALADDSLESYEEKLAKGINEKLGPKGSPTPMVDFVMDMHTTTSKMGLTLCISNDNPFTWQVAAHVKSAIPESSIFYWKGDTQDTSFISSIPPSGLTIEVGSVPQGVLRADMFFATEKIVHTILDFIDNFNSKEQKKEYEQVEIYNNIKMMDFPRDDSGKISAMVHPNLQDSGYVLIKKGDPIFVAFNGETINYEDDQALYALFINEAAYYEKGVAFCLAEKKTIHI